jgi:hypothetical protein
MTQLLVVIAALPFLLFGLGHGLLTLRDLRNPRAFTPPDAALRDAMMQSRLRFRVRELGQPVVVEPKPSCPRPRATATPCWWR